MRKLSYKALTVMEGQQVKVHDLAYDIYDQICYVRHRKEWIKEKGQQKRVLTGIHLENEEYIYTYTPTGKPSNGDFEVYTLNSDQDILVEKLEKQDRTTEIECKDTTQKDDTKNEKMAIEPKTEEKTLKNNCVDNS